MFFLNPSRKDLVNGMYCGLMEKASGVEDPGSEVIRSSCQTFGGNIVQRFRILF